MLGNPLTFFGFFVVAGGWVFLLFGVGADAQGFGTVYNLHTGSIANNVILLGYAMIVVGVLCEIGKAINGAPRDVLTETLPRLMPAPRVAEDETLWR